MIFSKRVLAENIVIKEDRIKGLPVKIEFRFPSIVGTKQVLLSKEDAHLIHSKILKNLDFFSMLHTLGIENIFITTAHFEMNEPGINFYIGAFLFSDFNEVFDLLRNNVDRQQNFHFVYPINTKPDLELNNEDLRTRNENWVKYYPKFQRGFYLDRP